MARVVLPIRGMPPSVPAGPVRQLGGLPVAAFKSGGPVKSKSAKKGKKK